MKAVYTLGFLVLLTSNCFAGFSDTGCLISFKTLDNIWAAQVGPDSVNEKKSQIKQALMTDRCMQFQLDIRSRASQFLYDQMSSQLAAPTAKFVDAEDLIGEKLGAM
jgi:hypothetical protein